jgi:hypothetical protein
MIEEQLTYLQKAALKGEIGFALSTSSHDTEIKFRTYLILKEVEDKFKPFIIECIKEAVTFDETIINRIYLEILNGTVPVWLWVEEAIADIKIHLNSAQISSSILTGLKLSIDKLQERKNLIESAFILFAREAMMISPLAVKQLLEEVLEDNDLDFLQSACFYLQESCKEIQKFKNSEEVPDKLMSCVFDIKKILSFGIETKELSRLNRFEKKQKTYEKVTKQPLPTEITGEVVAEGSFTVDNTFTSEEISQYISEKIAELFEGNVSTHSYLKPKQPSSTVYVVKKVFTDSGISTNIRVCRSEEEAVNFIKKIIKEYPELTNVCEFQVERINDKEKNNWGSQS